MTAVRLHVRHGEIDDVFGTPKVSDEVSFSAAVVELKGSSFQRSHDLSEYIASRNVPSETRRLFLDGYDGPWVRGRIQRVFPAATVTTAENAGEKSGLYFGFVAVWQDADGELVGVPFECNDYYLKTGLFFSQEEDAVPASVCDRIASAFWNLLLEEPHDLPEYTDVMYHIGAGIWLEFGIESGQPFITEHQDDPRMQHKRR
jgi:hypothetical protein